jgi:TolB-like protein/DNA-binding winged helix-turn-helix (wHTH) protein/Flp pilus assembly protein TadD
MTHPFRFGSAEVRPAERQLLVDGRPVIIGARALDVLNLLITHRERVVSKNELLEAVWPGLVVEENNLQVQISTLRKILGAGAITTVPGQGYQFTATLDSERGTVPDAGGPGTAPAIKQSAGQSAAPGASAEPAAPKRRSGTMRLGTWLAVGVAIVLVIGIGAWSLLRARWNAPTVLGTSTQQAPAHSVAVLPFVNMSGDPKQEYFSDGLSEELLNSLASIRDLQVAARTSSFSFKGDKNDVAEIAHKLNVGAVLEGSVRKDGGHVRITVQLINAVTGYLLWSQTYDRDLKDVLKLQTEIATDVTKALKATLLADAAVTIELGGTQNPQALDAYLRGVGLTDNAHTREGYEAAIGELSEAIRLDPRFAKAFARKAIVLFLSSAYVPESSVHETFEQARAAAEQAVALAPGLGEAHQALAVVLEAGYLDFTRAATEFDRALALAPGDARIQGVTAAFFAQMGRADEAIANTRRSVALDPLSAKTHFIAGVALHYSHRYREAIGEFNRALSLNPQLNEAAQDRGFVYLALGEFEPARKSCAPPPNEWASHLCLAIVYDKLHRRTEANKELAVLKAEHGDEIAYQYAELYAQWRDIPKALDWIEKAYQLRDPGLDYLKVDEMLDPIRQEPRFKEIERKLRFPN